MTDIWLIYDWYMTDIWLINDWYITYIWLMLMLRPLAVTPGVTHFGAYHRPPDGHFLLYREGLIGPNFFDPNLTWLLSFGSLSFQTCLNPRGRPQPDWPITVHFWPVSIWPLHCSKIPSPGKTNFKFDKFSAKINLRFKESPDVEVSPSDGQTEESRILLVGFPPNFL